MNTSNIVRTNATRIALELLASASLALLSEAALADEIAVTFKAQQLSSPAGVAAVYGRITRAAWQVCGALDGNGHFQAPVTQACINDAVSRAVAQVNSPMLTSFYNAKTRKAGKPGAIVAQTR